MGRAPLDILYVTHIPPSPPRTGAQRRIHGLLTGLAGRHRLAVACVAAPEEVADVERAVREYAAEAVVVPRTRALSGPGKRLLQVRALLSRRSHEHHHFREPRLFEEARALLDRRAFQVVNVETPFLFDPGLRRAPPGAPAPRLVVDEHNIEYDILRQVARSGAGALRRAYNAVGWRKVRAEERAAWHGADGVVLTSVADQGRLLAEAPGVTTAVVPNAVDVEFFRPRAGDPAPDGRTLVFFGAIDYFANTEGVLHFAREIWPALSSRRPALRWKIVGPNPPPEIRALAGPRVEVTGFVDDLRPHLASAAAVVVPLRIGGGTRLKIVEAMGMARPIVSTRLGAEGIEVTDGKDILLADEPAAFVAAVERVLDDDALAGALGRGGRALVEHRYSWTAAAGRLEEFFRRLLGEGSGAPAGWTASPGSERIAR